MFDFDNSDSREKIKYLGVGLQTSEGWLQTLEAYLSGSQPTAWLPDALKQQLQDRLLSVNVNLPDLIVSLYSERMGVSGFRLDGSHEPDPTLAKVLRGNDFLQRQTYVHRDYLALGRSYVSVASDGRGGVRIEPESPHQTIGYHDSATGALVGVLKSWTSLDPFTSQSATYATLYLQDRTEYWTSESGTNSPTGQGWTLAKTVANPFAPHLPIVEFVNAASSLDVLGTAEFAPVLNLVDALNKTFLDMLSASDSSGAPRKFISGLEVPEDEDGQPVNPFAVEQSRVWMAEEPEAKMIQFPGADLSNFETESNLIVRSIGAITGIPDYRLPVGMAAPQSADAQRIADLGLTTRVIRKTEMLTPAWAQVARLATALHTGRTVDSIEAEPIWRPTEDKSEAIGAQAVQLLVSVGVPLELALSRELGWTPEDIAALRAARATEPDHTLELAA